MRRLVAVTALTAIVGLAGCAIGNDDPGSDPTSTPSETSPNTPSEISPSSPTVSSATPTAGPLAPTPSASASLPAVTAPSSTPSTTPSTRTTGAPMPPVLDEIVAAAITDLGSRAVTGSRPVEVVSAGPFTFSDGSLGCPRPGMAYTQALVDGHRVILARGDRLYPYNAGRDHTPQLCPSDAPDLGYDVLPPVVNRGL